MHRDSRQGREMFKVLLSIRYDQSHPRLLRLSICAFDWFGGYGQINNSLLG